MYLTTAYVGLVLFSTVLNCLAGDIIIESKQDGCRKMASCSSCIAHSACTWCVTKSLCTKQLCGNDNVIFPKDIPALMAGRDFCPRVVEPKDQLTFKSGTKDIISVKLTQIYLYMAFTPWKCKIIVNNEETTVSAVLVGDSVYCELFEFKNQNGNSYTEGRVMVLWDYNKLFDGSVHFQVCRCDVDPSCNACQD